MCGFYMPNMIEKWYDYDFKNGEDYFENAFIAVKKNNPLIDKWHFVMN